MKMPAIDGSFILISRDNFSFVPLGPSMSTATAFIPSIQTVKPAQTVSTAFATHPAMFQ